jgi:hypothetical protein
MRAFLRSCLAILRSAAPRSAAPIDVCMIGDSTTSERTPEEAEHGGVSPESRSYLTG